MRSPRPTAASLFLEGFVILVSILAAFGLHAWWGQIQDREAEADHLQLLRSDFLETRRRLQATEDHERRVIEVARGLLKPEGEPPDGAVLDALLYDLWSLPTFEPVDGALQELLSSGGLRLIRDETLRRALAAWPSEVEGYRRREGWAQDVWNLFDAPYVMREQSLIQIFRGRLGDDLPNSHPRDHAQQLDDPYFQNLVAHRWVAALDVLGSLERVRDQNELILARLVVLTEE